MSKNTKLAVKDLADLQGITADTLMNIYGGVFSERHKLMFKEPYSKDVYFGKKRFSGVFVYEDGVLKKVGLTPQFLSGSFIHYYDVDYTMVRYWYCSTALREVYGDELSEFPNRLFLRRENMSVYCTSVREEGKTEYTNGDIVIIFNN